MKMKDMITKQIKLVTPQDVKEFCFAASGLPRNVSAVVSHNEFRVDGKSILGMFGLNLSEPVTLTITSEENLNVEKINTLFNKWEV